MNLIDKTLAVFCIMCLPAILFIFLLMLVAPERSVVVRAAMPGTTVVGAGATSSCVTTPSGVACFGLTDGVVPSGAVFTSIGVGAYTVCGIHDGTGVLACWGQNDAGACSVYVVVCVSSKHCMLCIRVSTRVPGAATRA
jgi:hypothetical protein